MNVTAEEQTHILYAVDLEQYGTFVSFRRQMIEADTGMDVHGTDVIVSGEFVMEAPGHQQQLKVDRSYADAHGRLGWERIAYAEVHGVLVPCRVRVVVYGRDGVPDLDQQFTRMFHVQTGAVQSESLQVNGTRRRERTYHVPEDDRHLVLEATYDLDGGVQHRATHERVEPGVWRMSHVGRPRHVNEDLQHARPQDVHFSLPGMQGFRRIDIPGHDVYVEIPLGIPTPVLASPCVQSCCARIVHA